jgi:hypothetical protein
VTVLGILGLVLAVVALVVDARGRRRRLKRRR